MRKENTNAMTAKAISHVNEWVFPDWISSAWVSADARLGGASGWDTVPLDAGWRRSGLRGMATGLTRMLGAVLDFAVAATVFFTLIGAQGIARTFGWVGWCDGAGSTVFMAKERETLGFRKSASSPDRGFPPDRRCGCCVPWSTIPLKS